MVKYSFSLIFMFFSIIVFGQYEYEPTSQNPYGLPNPKAPPEILDFAPLIGSCNCESVSRKADKSWSEPVTMKWRFKYIMNGMAVQDETLKEDGKHAGSIRQYIQDSTRWYVHYYSSGSPSTILPAWNGKKNKDGRIILYREQSAPNGMDGYYKINFYDISENGFNWLGEWVNKDETLSYPTWKITCKREFSMQSAEDKGKIKEAARQFSKAYINADYDNLMEVYASDAKIFPNNSSIIEGMNAIRQRWILAEGSKIIHHEILPEEINILGNYAYDYGYYNGSTQTANGNMVDWKGKYVVIWKKVKEDWKMYLDIWNRVVE